MTFTRGICWHRCVVTTVCIHVCCNSSANSAPTATFDLRWKYLLPKMCAGYLRALYVTCQKECCGFCNTLTNKCGISWLYASPLFPFQQHITSQVFSPIGIDHLFGCHEHIVITDMDGIGIPGISSIASLECLRLLARQVLVTYCYLICTAVLHSGLWNRVVLNYSIQCCMSPLWRS